MELSSKSEYALLALLELGKSHPNEEPLQIRQIAAQQSIPDRYLEQLLATLRRAGIVRSQRGAKGGYLLMRAPWQISLYEVVSCIEGFDLSKDTPILPQTPESMVIAEVWQTAKQAAESVLQETTLQDLLDQCRTKQQNDFMYYI